MIDSLTVHGETAKFVEWTKVCTTAAHFKAGSNLDCSRPTRISLTHKRRRSFGFPSYAILWFAHCSGTESREEQAEERAKVQEQCKIKSTRRFTCQIQLVLQLKQPTVFGVAKPAPVIKEKKAKSVPKKQADLAVSDLAQFFAVLILRVQTGQPTLFGLPTPTVKVVGKKRKSTKADGKVSLSVCISLKLIIACL